MAFNILNLHDYCFFEVIKYLEESDVAELALTCTWLNGLVKDEYNELYEKWKIEDKLIQRKYINPVTIKEIHLLGCKGLKKEQTPSKSVFINKVPWEKLKNLNDNMHLEKIYLHTCQQDMVEKILPEICNLPKLKALMIYNTNPLINQLQECRYHRNPQDLDLSDVEKFNQLVVFTIATTIITNLVEICKANKNLIELNLYHTRCKNLGKIAPYCEKLKILKFDYNINYWEDYEPLAALPQLELIEITAFNSGTLNRFDYDKHDSDNHQPLEKFAKLEISTSNSHTLNRFFKTLASKKPEILQKLTFYFSNNMTLSNMRNIFDSIGQLTSLSLLDCSYNEPYHLQCLTSLICLSDLTITQSNSENEFDISDEILNILQTCTILDHINLRGGILKKTFIQNAFDIVRKVRAIYSPPLQFRSNQLMENANLYPYMEIKHSRFNLKTSVSIEMLQKNWKKVLSQDMESLHIKGERGQRFPSAKMCEEVLKSLSDYPNLASLHIGSKLFDVNGLPKLTLRKLDLNTYLNEDQLMLISRNLLDLQYLILRDEACGRFINILHSCTNLRELQFKTNENAKEYERLAELSILEALEITGNHHGGTLIPLFQALSSKQNLQLTKLIIKSKNLTSSEIEGIGYLNSLQHLSCHFSDLNGLESLTKLTNLKYLDCEPTQEAFNKSISIPVCKILEACKFLDYIKLYSTNVELISDAFEVLKNIRDPSEMALKMIVPELQWEANILQDFYPFMELDFIRSTSTDDIEFLISNKIIFSEDGNGQSSNITDCSRFTHLEEIDIYMDFLIYDLIPVCQANQNLRTLKLRDSVTGPLCLIVPHCPNLENLQFNINRNDHNIEMLADLPKLKSLTISGDHHSNNFMGLLKKLSSMENQTLKSLIIKIQCISSNEFKEIGKLKSIEHLSCRYYDPTCLKNLEKLTNLSSLEIQPVFSAQHRFISRPLLNILRTCTHLSSLVITSCAIGTDTFNYAYKVLMRVRNPNDQAPLRMYISDNDFYKLSAKTEEGSFLPYLQIEPTYKLYKTYHDMDLLKANKVKIDLNELRNLNESSKLIQHRWNEFINKAKYNNRLEDLQIDMENYKRSNDPIHDILRVVTKFPLLKYFKPIGDFSDNPFSDLNLVTEIDWSQFNAKDFGYLIEEYKYTKVKSLKVFSNEDLIGFHYFSNLIVEERLDIDQIKFDSHILKELLLRDDKSVSLLQKLKNLNHVSCQYSVPVELEFIQDFSYLKSLDVYSVLASDNNSLPIQLIQILRKCTLLEYIAFPYFDKQLYFFHDANNVLIEVRNPDTQDPLVFHTSTIIISDFLPYLKIYNRMALEDFNRVNFYNGYCS